MRLSLFHELVHDFPFTFERVLDILRLRDIERLQLHQHQHHRIVSQQFAPVHRLDAVLCEVRHLF